ncbi:MAG: flagellar hook capping FlgD N-terminal domain-containing protein [Pirellulales bacterium]
MSRVSGTGSTSSSGSSQTKTTGNDLGNVNLDEFLQLMITELQNQDPLNPTDNSEMLAQMTQIRQMGATNQLTDALTSLSMGQSLTQASNLIGKKVTALDDKSKEISGVVDRVSVKIDEKDRTKRDVKLHVGDATVDINNVREIVQPDAA